MCSQKYKPMQHTIAKSFASKNGRNYMMQFVQSQQKHLEEVFNTITYDHYVSFYFRGYELMYRIQGRHRQCGMMDVCLLERSFMFNDLWHFGHNLSHIISQTRKELSEMINSLYEIGCTEKLSEEQIAILVAGLVLVDVDPHFEKTMVLQKVSHMFQSRFIYNPNVAIETYCSVSKYDHLYILVRLYQRVFNKISKLIDVWLPAEVVREICELALSLSCWIHEDQCLPPKFDHSIKITMLYPHTQVNNFILDPPKVHIDDTIEQTQHVPRAIGNHTITINTLQEISKREQNDAAKYAQQKNLKQQFAQQQTQQFAHKYTRKNLPEHMIFRSQSRKK